MNEIKKGKKQAQLERLLEQLPKNMDKQLMEIPGIYYGGGCSYMACRGLMMGPISDVLLITHGPTGCGCFSGINGRREKNDGVKTAHDGRIFSTNMCEQDIIFGGEDKLLNAIGEAVALYHPKVIAICATCPIGLIGDDIEQVARTAEKNFGVPVLPLSCEGFKTNGGWLHGGKMIVENWMGTKESPHGAFSIHYMSESYCGPQKKELDGIFSRIGYDVICSMMGATTYEAIRSGHSARLIVLDSGKAIDEVPQMMAKKYGSTFFRIDMTGISNVVASLRKIADFFGDKGVSARTEEVIASETERIKNDWTRYRAHFCGKSAALFEDIFRSDSFASLCSDLGMEIIMISQDYSREEYTDENFLLHISEELYNKNAGVFTEQSKKHDRRVYFTLSRSRVSEILRVLKPDVCFAGIEEQFGYGDAPIRSELFTSDERGVSYSCFSGFLRFAKDLEMEETMSHWITRPPKWILKESENG